MKNFTLDLLFVFVFSISYTIFPQWSSDPNTNLMVCDTTGEQALSKIASTSDGGCYISWFDSRSGSYAVYLQKLDLSGNKLWGENGLLVSNNPQSSSLVDYDLMADANDNAVVVFTDTRNSGNLNVFAYMISPTGNFVWGSNGVSLSTTSDFQANPKVTETVDGNFVVAWIVATSPTKVALQKISPAGAKLWGPDPVLIQSGSEGYNNPDVVQTDSNGVIVVHTATTGSFPAQTVKIRANKISVDGNLLWGTGGINIQNLGTIAAFSVPKVYSDNNNGAIVAWHDDRDMNNLQSAFVQHISSTGSLYFPTDGAEVSLAPSRHKFNPVAAFDNSTGNMFVFWRETEPNQNQNGIYGQKLSSDGSRLWTDNAKVFKDLSVPLTSSISSLSTQLGSDRVYVFYLEGNGSGINQKVEGFATDFDGNFLWTGNFVTLSNPNSEKLQMVSIVDVYSNCKMSWGDRRSGNQGIYAQDINPNGELGNPVVPVELVSFSASQQNNSVILNWVTASEINNSGFEIEKREMSKVKSQTWQKIGFVQGNGTVTQTSIYSFNDTEIEQGTYYYRLKQIDFDGSFEYSNVIEVSTLQPEEFSLNQNYPNPFNPVTSIEYTVPSNVKSETANVTLKVYDVLGNEVATLVNENKSAGIYEVEFNASKLTSGTYFYKLTFDKLYSVKKMILIK